MTLDRPLQYADLEAVGPGTPAGRYLRLYWHPVMRAQDLRPKQAKPLEILGEKFTIYRGEDGTPHVTHARCPHRGALMSLGWVEGDDLRCRFHGWKFDGSGQCIEQPNEDRPFCARVKMQIYPTREYVGLIFAYLGEGEPPPFRQYPDFDTPGVIVADPPEVIPCTFWNRLDTDNSHVPWVHRASALRTGRTSSLTMRKEGVEETPYGYVSYRSLNREAVGYRNQAHFFMPNARQFWKKMGMKGFLDRDIVEAKMTWSVPVNDAKFVAFDVTNTPLEGEDARRYAAIRAETQGGEVETRWALAEKILAGEMTVEDLPKDMDAYTSFAIEDYVTQVGQGPIAGRAKEMLGSTDVKPVLLRRMWLREVTALLEGRPVTDWKIPARPLQVLENA
ncbi:MAG TPA: Rieske 2Fe-2S domain-containing protein [Stellaceae bacterium]|jgi:5,5'-dehydrodivanillate O-demethylase|nr:Rieske 2Fe-2S domain-containing protein [Stellaceae bacterium]